jgi:hypothetical protein
MNLQMRVAFEARNTPEVFIRFREIRVGWLPLPEALRSEVERRVNPLIDIREWPLRFRISAVAVTAAHVVMSSKQDLSQPCHFCVTPP